mgnify:CR=1 FL=1
MPSPDLHDDDAVRPDIPVATFPLAWALVPALVLAGLMVFIAAHAFGQGAVIWVFISEIFPNRIRGRGQALGVGRGRAGERVF